MKYPLKAHERLALLEAWDGHCAWLKHPLDYWDMQVDHLLPSVLARAGGDPWLDAVRSHVPPGTVVKSPEEFDVDELYNLIPSCAMHNRLKSDDVPFIAGTLLALAAELVSTIQAAAARLLSDRALQKAFAVIDSADEAAKADVVTRLVQAGVDTDVIRRLVRLNVAHSAVTYPNGHGQGTASRRLWLVVPPAERALAVVLEDPNDGGRWIQQAAEDIADIIERDYPGYLTVLHYDREGDKSWGNAWMPVLPGYEFGRGVTEELREEMNRSLRAVGLQEPDA